ncbi:hypothetical protein [Sphingosinicella rhizophila]|uniref:Uncharacterized protein n=1 Tax=Sphingosinicella rhizophila TaxID=3050082 RepID=A0ABU3Q829_9SPHN|nr:hypothetical protein [Sphingosinicella sp. GR2756]MDT9599447.1 hypothetical protein [Sphingosinicella sp. GR2756]
MFRSLIAVTLLAAPMAATSQTGNGGRWGLAGFPGGCMVHATSPQGTVLSIWGFAGQENLGILVQNRQWHALREGERHNLKVAFDRNHSWPVRATARRDIDADGPGLFFTVKPGSRSDQAGFFEAFAAARGMDISREGRRVDRLPLAGSREAMFALANCMGALWQGMAAASANEEETAAPAGPTI